MNFPLDYNPLYSRNYGGATLSPQEAADLAGSEMCECGDRREDHDEDRCPDTYSAPWSARWFTPAQYEQ